MEPSISPPNKKPKLISENNGDNLDSKTDISENSISNQDSDDSSCDEEPQKHPILTFFYRRARPKRDPLDLFNQKPYESTLDLSKYNYSDITIKVMKLNTILVNAKGRSEDVPDYENTIRLSNFYNTDLLTATFDDEGKLKIEVPTIVAKRPLERIVPIINLQQKS